MARTTKPLTNTEVKQSKPKDKVYKLSDGGGLQLRIRPNGTKSWLFDYKRPYTNKRANISFGAFPSIGLAEARIKREEAKELLAKDIDPKEYRDEQLRKLELEHNNTLQHIASNGLKSKNQKYQPIMLPIHGDH